MELGYIEDDSDASARDRSIRLTETGRQILSKGRPLWASAQAEIDRKIGKEKADELTQLIQKLLD